MCANDYVLNKVLRGFWARPDAHIQSDCGAISNQLGDQEHYARNKSDAAAKVGTSYSTSSAPRRVASRRCKVCTQRVVAPAIANA